MITLSQEITEFLERGGTLIVPTRQRAEALRLAFAAAALSRGLRVWPTVDVIPLDAWLGRQVNERAAVNPALPRLLSPAEEWVIWRDATAEVTDGWQLISQATLADALRLADQLATQYGLRLPQGMAEGVEHSLLHAVRAIVEQKRQRLSAANAWNLTAEEAGSQDAVAFAGFITITPFMRELIETRRAAGFETVVLAGHAGPEAQARVVQATDSRRQLERIARWCRDAIVRQPDARLLILLPGLAVARERLARLIQQEIDPSRSLGSGASDASAIAVIEGGNPLSTQPLIAHALVSLRVLTKSVDFEEFSEWLRSPFWEEKDAARGRLDLWLRRQGTLEMTAGQLRSMLARATGPIEIIARDLLERIGRALDALGGGSGMPTEWSERLHKSLQALGWPGPRIRDSAEQQTCERFLELLREFGLLTSSTGSLSLADAIRAFTELANRTAFRPASGDSPITISGSMIDPIGHYDGIWVAGLDADSWPQPARPDPFLPLSAQVAAGIPEASAGGRLTQARSLMSAWARASTELVLSFAALAEDRELLPSRLLQGLPLLDAPDPVTDLWIATLMHRDNVLELFTDAVGLPWQRDLRLPGGTRSLFLQNECAFRAYAQLRLGCEPPEAPEPGIGADMRGRLLHDSLERLWTALADQRSLLALDRAGLTLLIEGCVAKSAAQLWLNADTPQHLRELRRATRLILALCALEATRNPFRVEHTELDTVLSLAGGELQVRIDRIDALEEGGLAILDYKSGAKRGSAQTNWYDERPSHIQLLAYREVVGDAVRAMANVHIVTGKAVFDGVGAYANVLPKLKAVEGEPAGDAWSDRIAVWHGLLERLVTEFLAGSAVVDPRPQACTYCHLATLCRIRELDREPEELEEGVSE